MVKFRKTDSVVNKTRTFEKLIRSEVAVLRYVVVDPTLSIRKMNEHVLIDSYNFVSERAQNETNSYLTFVSLINVLFFNRYYESQNIPRNTYSTNAKLIAVDASSKSVKVHNFLFEFSNTSGAF